MPFAALFDSPRRTNGGLRPSDRPRPRWLRGSDSILVILVCDRSKSACVLVEAHPSNVCLSPPLERAITAEEAPLLVRSLLSAGLDTTIVGIGNGLYAFATNPAQWQALREKPALVRPAFDEVLRWESPIQTFFRTTTRAVDIGGIEIPQDAKVLLFLASANRDPRRWDEPERASPGSVRDRSRVTRLGP
jgi:cytochrome P450